MTAWNRALCCECGQVRTVAATYLGKAPAGAPAVDEKARWTNWLRCAVCRRTTQHAVLQDAVRATLDGNHDPGDLMERENARVDRAARRLTRRLAGLEAVGVRVEWCAHAAVAVDESNYPAAVEVRRNGPIAYLVLELWEGAPRTDLLSAVEHFEELVDDRTQPIELRLGDDGLVLR